jgi:hypothetical protein
LDSLRQVIAIAGNRVDVALADARPTSCEIAAMRVPSRFGFIAVHDASFYGAPASTAGATRVPCHFARAFKALVANIRTGMCRNE